MTAWHYLKSIAFLILCLSTLYLLSGCAGMKYYEPSARWNIYEKRWEQVTPKAISKFNVYEKEWRYVEP